MTNRCSEYKMDFSFELRVVYLLYKNYKAIRFLNNVNYYSHKAKKLQYLHITKFKILIILTSFNF